MSQIFLGVQINEITNELMNKLIDFFLLLRLNMNRLTDLHEIQNVDVGY